jgi:hypothetical protein
VVQAFMKARLRRCVHSSRCTASSPHCLVAGLDSWRAQIYKEEGLRAFWKGNGTNVIRVAPYAAAQLSSNDFYKRQLSGSCACCRSAALLRSRHSPAGPQTKTATCRCRDG